MKNIFTASSIATKLWVWFLIVAAGPLIIVGLLTNNSSIETIKAEVSNRLNSVAESKTELINNYFKWRLEDIKVFSENLSVIEACEKFSRVFEKFGQKSLEYKVVDKKFRRFLTYYKEGGGYADISFISKAGDVVFTLIHEMDFGTNLIIGPYKDTELANVFSNAYTLMEMEVSDFKYYPPAAEPSSFIASPVRKEGEFIGVIAFQIDTSAMNKLAQDFTGLGETGEIVISAKIDNGAMVLTPVRHDPDAAFKRIIAMGSEMGIPSQRAVQGHKGSGIFKDYRGKEVLAVWRYLPYLRWGVVVKIDASEAYMPIYKLRTRFLAVGFISVFVLLFISFFLSKSISKPIKRLQEGVEIIATGNLNHVVGLNTKDEIGQLSRSFDRMVVNLKNINADLTKEITERKRTEEEIIMLATALKRINECVSITDVEDTIIFVNEAFLLNYGYSEKELIGKNISIIRPPSSPPKVFAEVLPATLSGGWTGELINRRKDGSEFPIFLSTTIIEKKDGKPNHLIGIAINISERKRVESQREAALESLRESEERYQNLARISPVGIFRTDKNGATTYVNPMWCLISGLSEAEAMGDGWLGAVHPDDRERLGKGWQEMIRLQKPSFADYRFLRPDGTIAWVMGQASPEMNSENQLVGYVGTITDITERKRAEELIRISLVEKEVLLKEVHHRVKNNLMTIIGLIKMQETKAHNKMFNPLLHELEGRVRAMALVHESLHNSADLAHVDLQNYIETMSAHICAQFGADRDIRFSVQAAGVDVGLDIAVSCGLIMNELIANACKHAFPGGKPRSGAGDCKISVAVVQQGGMLKLTVADNGIGLPAGTNWENPETLGLRLVKMLTNQINGSIELDRSRGTAFHLSFANANAAG